MNSKIDIKDVLICHTSCVMKHDGKVTTTINRKYFIKEIYTKENNFTIKNDLGQTHHFSYDVDYHSYYQQWFYIDVKEIRRKKLKKILNNSI